MRLSALTLESYGPFRRLELAFATDPGVVNLVVAPNGRGKSVVRRAIGDLLFDIPNQSPMTYLHGTQNMRLIAGIRMPDGSDRQLVRRKGRGNTLSDGDDRHVPPDALQQMVGTADEALFRELFALDTLLLREGGEALLKSDGRLGQVLFAGSGGLARVFRTLEALEKQRDELGRADRSAKGRPLWAAHDLFVTAQRALTAAALRPDAWAALDRAATEAAARRDAARAEQARVNAELARLHRSRALRPHLAARADALARLAELADVPRLDAAFEPRWRAALEEATRAASAAEATRRHAAALRDGHAEIALDTALLEAGDAIDDLARLVVTAANSERDLPGVAAEWEEDTRRATWLRHELGWDASVETPALAVAVRARTHLQLWPALDRSHATAVKEQADAAEALAAAEAARDALAAPTDLAAAEAVLTEISPLGDPVRLIATAESTLTSARAALDKAVAAIPELRIDREALVLAPPLAVASLAACETELSDAETAARNARRDHDKIVREIDAAESALADLTQFADLPAPGSLAAARVRRDALWDEVVRALAAPPASPGAALAYERALREADDVADALVAHSAEIADAESRRRLLVARRAEAEKAAAERIAADRRIAAARDRFAALADAAGAAGIASPAALREAMTARAAALDRKIELDRATAARDELRGRLDRLSHRLADALAIAVPETVEGFAAAIRQATDRVEANGRLRDAHAEHARRLVEPAATARRRTAAVAASGRALAAWRDDWAEMARAVLRPADEGAAAAGAALTQMDELRTVEAKRDKAATRVAAMRASMDALTQAVGSVAEFLTLEPSEGLPAKIARDLAKRLLDERARAERSRQHAKNVRDAERAEAEGRELEATARRHVVALHAALHVDSDEAAERQILRARDAIGAEADRRAAEAQLLETGGGRPIAELETLVQGEAREDEEIAIAQLSERQTELAAAVETAAAEARSADEHRARVAAETDVALHAERRETGIAQLSRIADDALLLHAAWSLLKAGLERQRDGSEDGMLRRIGAVFQTLTVGAHAGVAIDDNGGKPVVVALEADGIGRKPIAHLSEGTRDQLFLALRIVALEAYAASEPALPFIADDVLQTFDDARAEAGLRALLGLSHHVQVIALTHHPHVAEIARGLGEGVVRCLALPAE